MESMAAIALAIADDDDDDDDLIIDLVGLPSYIYDDDDDEIIVSGSGGLGLMEGRFEKYVMREFGERSSYRMFLTLMLCKSMGPARCEDEALKKVMRKFEIIILFSIQQ